MHRSALSTAQDIGSQKDIVGALLNIADVESSQGQIEDSQKNLAQAIVIATAAGDTQQILLWQNNRAVDLYILGDYFAAKKIYEEVISTAKTIGDQGRMTDAMLNLGALLFQVGELQEAQQNTLEALAIADKAGLQSEKASALNNLGDIQSARGDLPAARKSYGDALQLATRINDQANVAGSHLSLAKLALEEGKGSDSENLARKAIAEFQSQNLSDNEADAHNTLAGALIAENKLSDAAAEIDKAGKLAPQDRVVQSSIQITAARLKARSGKLEEARQDFDSQLLATKEKRLVGLQLEIRLALAEIEVSSGTKPNGVAFLTALENDARDSGYLLIATKAHHLQQLPSR